ncbi:MAG: HD domain-containing protein [Candidatus Omnitrophica bacterium]|nr:HD domain-containing protein [Candidatus Omnitrophota bacterium]
MKNTSNEEIYFTPKQAAAYFNLSLSTVKNYIYAGKLKTLKTPGGHHRIPKAELLITLSDKIKSKEELHNLSLKDDLCASMLTIFKALGSLGNSLIIHAQEVAELSSNIARAIGMDEVDIKRIEIAAQLHDIGQIGVDKSILLKPDRLTFQEYELIKNHPRIGKEVISSMKALKDTAEIIAQHHERVDGKGYPVGLRGDEIQIGARIISIAEAYNSMVSTYSYKRPVSKDMAIDELIRHKGTQFDGEIIKLALELVG